MTATAPARSDALVFFGATGDLAYKKIFPALQGMAKHGTLTVPVIGVAGSGWTLDQLRERARASIEEYGGGVDPAAGLSPPGPCAPTAPPPLPLWRCGMTVGMTSTVCPDRGVLSVRWDVA